MTKMLEPTCYTDEGFLDEFVCKIFATAEQVRQPLGVRCVQLVEMREVHNSPLDLHPLAYRIHTNPKIQTTARMLQEGGYFLARKRRLRALR